MWWRRRSGTARCMSMPMCFCLSLSRYSAGCSASAFATSTSSSITRRRISAPGCRPISPSSSGARQAIFEFLERKRGEGWWGKPEMARYYAEQARGDDPFNWIKGHPLMTPEIIGQYPFDHAGEGETSLLLALSPEGVDMDRLSAETWYTKSARDASAETGARGRDLILAHLRAVLR
jgi:hypothetical protein